MPAKVRSVPVRRPRPLPADHPLGDAVEKAMAAMATALLEEKANRRHCRGLADGDLASDPLHDALCRLLLQIMVLSAAAVPRSKSPLIHTPDRSRVAIAARRRLVAAVGSIGVLGPTPEAASRPQPSLWRIFHEVAAAIGGSPEGANARERFAIAPIGGTLFGPSASPQDRRIDLARWELRDERFIAAISPWRSAIAAHLATRGSIGHLELGGVLSRLLDLELRAAPDGGVQLAASPRRRRLGSHFTPPALVEHLLATALDPLIAEACSGEHPEKALLAITVCDPSAGAGHLLVAAGQRLAAALARVRGTDPHQPAIRTVLRRCIHGIERDPLTLAVCEASLWLEAATPGLAMHEAAAGLRLGDALLGAEPSLLAEDLRDEASSTRRKDGGREASPLRRKPPASRVAATPDPIAFTQATADAWCAAFFGAGGDLPRTRAARRRLVTIAASPPSAEASTTLRDEIDRIAASQAFLHPHLAFPEVFAEGGFACIVGNPPFLNRLAAGTAAPPPAAALLRRRSGDAVRGYADAATAFLLIWSRLLRPGGRLSMVQPQSLLGARDAAPVRQAILRHAGLANLWVAGEPIFEQTAVLTCAPTLVAGEPPALLERRRGGAFRRLDPLPIDAASLRSAGSWSQLAIDDAEIPRIEVASGGSLGGIADASADFRDEYYALEGAIVEAAAGSGPATPPVLTSGLVDLACCRWGESPTRLHRTRWMAPCIEASRLAERHRAWLARRLVPKVVLATQTRLLEAFVDAEGRFLPCTPLISIMPRRPEDLWRVAAVAASPASTLRLRREHAGTALTDDAIKPTAAAVRSLPLPADRIRWDRSAAALRDAHAAASAEARREHLVRFAEESCRAMVSDAAEASRLAAWWLARFEAASSRRRRGGAPELR